MRRPTPRQFRKALDAAETPEFTPSTHVETLRDRMDRGEFTTTGWEAPANLSDEGWLHTGDAILAIEKALPWVWGDWYSARSALAAERLLRPDWNGPSIHTLQNYASVAKSFPRSRRREEPVSFKHHAELASLSKSEQDALLDLCATARLSVADLRAERQRRAAAKLPPPKPPLQITVTKVEPPPVVAQVVATKESGPPSWSPPGPPVELPPYFDIAVPVQLFLPTDLHAWAAAKAAGENMSLGAWITQLIEQARE